MKREVAEKWVAALRSGGYDQCTGLLEHFYSDGTSGFCCLGVLCRVVGAHREVSLNRDVWYSAISSDGWHADSSSTALTDEIRESVGMKTFEGDLYYSEIDDGTISLAVLNDAGFTFDQIADIIEYFWEVL